MPVASLPLLQQAHVTYLGAYRVPLASHPSETKVGPLSFASGKCVYNAANNSLIMAGNESPTGPEDAYQNLCEIQLPVASPSQSPVLADLPVSTWIGPSKNVTQYITPMVGSWYYGNGQKFGSLTIDTVNSRLVVGSFIDYDGDTPSHATRPSHFSIPLDFQTTSGANVYQMRVKQGTYNISTGGTATLGGAAFATYSSKVPSEWQSVGEFDGVNHLCGATQLSIVSRTGASPTAWSLDLNYFSLPEGHPDLATPQPSQIFLHSYVSDLTWPYEGAGNGTTMAAGLPQMPFNATGQITGMVAVPGTRTLMYTGAVGDGYIYYGGEDSNVLSVPFTNGLQDDKFFTKSFHSVVLPAGFRKLPLDPVLYDETGSPNNHGTYLKYCCLYDAVDLLRVKAGTLHPKDLMPYSYFPMSTPIQAVKPSTGGQAWDVTNRRLFVLDNGADIYGYDYRPLIHVWSLATPGEESGPTIVGNSGELTKVGFTY